METAIFGGGCFWCTEAVFTSLKGVISVVPGYCGPLADSGQVAPTYDKVSMGNTGYVECIKIEFDPQKISFGDLLSVFFNTHDPTTLNRQGADIGTQYASVIFYTTQAQKEEAEKLIQELNKTKAYGEDKVVVTELKSFEQTNGFFEAEDYHKNYYAEHPEAAYCEIVIAPKLEKLQKRFNNLIKQY